MTERKTILQRMDDVARWTGVPRLTDQRRRRRRPFKWLSTFALGAAVLGYITALATGFAGATMWPGYIAIMAGFLVGTILQVFGPLKPFHSGERVDEFDKALRDRAYLVTFVWFALATALGIIVLMFMLVSQATQPALVMCLTDFALLLVTLGSALPTVYASWAIEWDTGEG